MPQQLINPYDLPNRKDAEYRRLNVDIIADDFNYIAAIVPARGTISAVGARLWQAFVVYCREQGITNYNDAARFIELTNNLRIGGTATRTLPQATRPDERGGVTSVHNLPSVDTHSSPDAPSVDTSVGKGRAKRGQSTKRKVTA